MRSLAGPSRKPLLALLALFFAVSASPLSSGPAVAGSDDPEIKKYGGPSPSTSSGRDAAREQDRRMNDIGQGDDGGDGDGGGGGGGGGGGSH